MRHAATLLLFLVLAATGCGDDSGSAAVGEPATSSLDDGTTTTTAAEATDSEAVCAQLAIVERLDREAARVTDSAMAHIRAGAEPELAITALHESAAMIEAGQPDVVAAYAAAAAAAEPGLAADIEALASASATLFPLMVEAFNSVGSVDDLATLEQAFTSPEVLAAARQGAAAAQSLDRFTEVLCGFTMTD